LRGLFQNSRHEVWIFCLQAIRVIGDGFDFTLDEVFDGVPELLLLC